MPDSSRMKPKILVVDDEPDALEVLGFKLREAGCTAIFATDGIKALAAVKNERPDLIVLDLMLPEIDGMEVCKILRRDPTTVAIPILMLTAKAAEMDRVLGLELGADDYVTKPYSPRELVLRIRKPKRPFTRVRGSSPRSRRRRQLIRRFHIQSRKCRRNAEGGVWRSLPASSVCCRSLGSFARVGSTRGTPLTHHASSWCPSA